MSDIPKPFLDDFYSKILIILITASVSVLVTLLIEKFKNRLLVLKKNISYQLIGMSSLSDTWGGY